MDDSSAFFLASGVLPQRGSQLERCLPAAALREHVAAYFSVHVGCSDSAVSVRAVPDGCCDLMFDLRKTSFAWLRGPRTSGTLYEHSAPTRLVGVQLLPGAAHALTQISTHLLVDQTMDLARLWHEAGSDTPSLLSLIRALGQSRSLRAQAHLLDRFLVASFAARQIDARVTRAYCIMRSATDRVEMASLASACATGERNLGRLFKLWVGLSPKRLERVLRFQRILETVERGERPDWRSLAYDLGYSDQSHLVREYATFVGLPPSVGVARR